MPRRSVLYNKIVPHPATFQDEDERYKDKPSFRLQDFLRKVSKTQQLPLSCVTKAVLSRHNYKQIQQLLYEEARLGNQTKVNFKQFHPPG